LRKADGDDAYHPFVTPTREHSRIAFAAAGFEHRSVKKEAADRMIGGRDCLCSLAG
jgi:hypothetical protein